MIFSLYRCDLLIRFIVNNFLSFGKETEFAFFPNSKLKRNQEHIYSARGQELLKTSAIYGANASGKSNLIKSIDALQAFIVDEKDADYLTSDKHKIPVENTGNKTEFCIEFIQDDVPFIYLVELVGNIVLREELYESGTGKKADIPLFIRSSSNESGSSLRLSEEFEKDEKNQFLKSIILDEFLKKEKPIFKDLTRRNNEHVSKIKLAYEWFSDSLQIITPESHYAALAYRIDKSPEFRSFTSDLLNSFGTGVSGLSLKDTPLESYNSVKAEELEVLKKDIDKSPNKVVFLPPSHGGVYEAAVKEGENYVVKKILLKHDFLNKGSMHFESNEESDGTLRLLDLIPAFFILRSKKCIFIVDEIERSIHPLLIKKLIGKFTSDTNTKGQLLFTTHETCLLDQEMLRPDEIWFTEKSPEGSTVLYSLNDFREHHTIDIQKGYLSGRYGAIPFLGNLEELNWHSNEYTEEKISTGTPQ